MSRAIILAIALVACGGVDVVGAASTSGSGGAGGFGGGATTTIAATASAGGAAVDAGDLDAGANCTPFDPPGPAPYCLAQGHADHPYGYTCAKPPDVAHCIDVGATAPIYCCDEVQS